MTLAELRAADPLLADAIVEGVGSRVAFAEMIVGRISELAAECALAVERRRVRSHVALATVAGRDVALAAIADGRTVEDVGDAYVKAAAAVRDARQAGPQLVELHDTAAELQQAGDAK